MQTFLPYEDFKKSAKCLDRMRLGKQRVECYQILKVLVGESKGKGWHNHPATLMWKDNVYALCIYGITIINEWTSRGYKDTLKEKIKNLMIKYSINGGYYPKWLGNENFHASHRSNLLRKNYEWYKQFNWAEQNNLEYVWPNKTIGEKYEQSKTS